MGGTRADTSATDLLPLSRNGWRGLVAVTLGLFAISVPARFEELRTIALAAERSGTEGLWSLLNRASSPDIYPTLVLGLEISFVAGLFLVGLLIAAGRDNDRRNLFFSAVFITYSVWVTPTLDALADHALLEHVIGLVQAVGLIMAIHFFLLFPDGRFMPRWTRISSAFWIVYTLAWGIFPDAWFSLMNPFTVPFAVFAALMFGWVTGLVAQAARYRSDLTPQERRQTRWVMIAIAGAVAGYGAIYLPRILLPETGTARLAYDLFGVPVFWLLAMPMAFALAIAMLRYQLFDFHAAVNRTLVYGSLTATLAAAYLGMVTLLGRILHPLTGTSDIAVAASTLTVAGLFTPARGRIQEAIDRRFYRNRYDGTLALERFSRCIREQVELDAVEGELLELVNETMRPATVSLSLIRPGDGAASSVAS